MYWSMSARQANARSVLKRLATKKGVVEVEEEVALLEEQLASAHADVERLQEQLAEANARAESRETAGAELKQQLSEARNLLAERDEALSTRTGEVEELRGTLAGAQEGARVAAARYRDLLLAAEPQLPSDLVAGDSIEEVDAAVERARQTVAQVRRHLEQQAQAIRVPAGAPPRGVPDLADLSPADKIRAGLQDR